MMELKELLAWFDQGGSFGEDPEVVACMRRYIQENRRLLFEMNNLWHEDENEITELFKKITAKPVGEGVRIETPFHTDFGKNITLGNRVFINAGCKFQDQGRHRHRRRFTDRAQCGAGHAGPRSCPGQTAHPPSGSDPHRKQCLDRRGRCGHKGRDDRGQFRHRRRSRGDP